MFHCSAKQISVSQTWYFLPYFLWHIGKFSRVHSSLDWCQCRSLWVRRWISTDLSPVSAAAWPSQAAPGPGSPDPGLARLSEPRSGAHCACATRDTRNKNTGELETCTAGDYHMLAVIKTSSRNLWLADTGLTLDIRLSSLRFLHDLCSLYLVSSLWSTSAQSRSNIVRNKCSS